MITVYSKPNCKFCTSAKLWLDAREVEYQVIDITENEAAKDFIVSQGHKTVPQIYVGNFLMAKGGYEGLAKMTIEEVKSFDATFNGLTSMPITTVQTSSEAFDDGAKLLKESEEMSRDNGVEDK